MLDNGELVWRDGPTESFDKQVIATVKEPFKVDGGLSVLCGNLGRAVMKTSALREPHCKITAPAVVFEDQFELHEAFKAGELNKDCIVVVRFQGPSAIGMPELHSLTPPLAVLQDRGFKVALVTDGRMSGASGKVPAAIHVTPEAIKGGILAKVQTGDVIELNTETGAMDILISDEVLAKREATVPDVAKHQVGMGREMFAGMRSTLTGAEQGACSLFVGQD
jgi:phosphogluconate dehydratase